MTSGEREGAEGCMGVALFAADACTMGVPYTCVECVWVCAITAAVFTLWFVCSLSTALNCKPSSVNSLIATGHSASHNSDTCRPAGEYRSETKTGKEKAKTNRGTTAVVWYNLENTKQRQVSLSLSHTHTHVRTLRRMQTKTVFATLQHFTRVSTCLLLIVLLI